MNAPEQPTGRADEAGRDELTHAVIGAAITVHRELGPGLLESVYQQCLACELSHLGLSFEREASHPIRYRGLLIQAGYRVDFLVEGTVIVELKAVDALNAMHTSQVLTYLRVFERRVGLLINFHAPTLRQGLKRLIVDLSPGSASSRVTSPD